MLYYRGGVQYKPWDTRLICKTFPWCSSNVVISSTIHSCLQPRVWEWRLVCRTQYLRMPWWLDWKSLSARYLRQLHLLSSYTSIYSFIYEGSTTKKKFCTSTIEIHMKCESHNATWNTLEVHRNQKPWKYGKSMEVYRNLEISYNVADFLEFLYLKIRNPVHLQSLLLNPHFFMIASAHYDLRMEPWVRWNFQHYPVWSSFWIQTLYFCCHYSYLRPTLWTKWNMHMARVLWLLEINI